MKEELIHDFEEAKERINKWKAHILRSINQEKAKHEILESLDDVFQKNSLTGMENVD